ncbi:uncharacterized protein DUF402 [Brevibacterium sanguinis]|uniref:Uncharacterized protein DUF402 n=2 Tax=Brevibacterium TaxID=1696 RepID=A0A366IFF1_9MICO|nr:MULTISPECIES: DUF402 domain-containing protein [Brevibacterium]RBP62566.1 uncharacterized protein DUF402 [Brevibacterium sanguinis]RBP69230.1 uncharacterized protein DUF402 [Brevibacterium celere]
MDPTDPGAFTDPYALDVPDDAGFVGEPPFWSPGATVTWTFRRFDFDRDGAELRRPMQVVEDGPDGAVLWLQGGTPTIDTRIVGWEDSNPHDVPLRHRFGPAASAPRRVTVAGSWRGPGVLKIVPARVPFSVWVLLRPGGWADWYVNLEATHRRTESAILTSDHILDITFPQAGAQPHTSRLRPSEFLRPELAVFKDVDEIAAAAAFGMWPVEWSDIIRGNGMRVLENLDDFAWAFDIRWERLARDLATGGRQPGAASASTREATRGTEPDGIRESHRVGSGCYRRDWI